MVHTDEMVQNILISIFGEGYSWQDIVIATVSLMFGAILLPQLVDVWHGKTTLNLYTASLTTIGLFILTITFFTMQFWASFIADFISGIIWLLLFLFSVRNIKKKK
jgi:Zn-dependent protease with chaperone function